MTRWKDGPRLLLLSRSTCWSESARVEAAALGLADPHDVERPEDAVALLAAGARFSHLLLHGPSAGNLLPDLIGMTAGEAESGTAAVLLGMDGDAARHAPGAERVAVVPDTAAGWLAHALTATAGRRGPAELPLDDLMAALATGRIHTRYQPIVRLTDRRPMGLEVLARLEHPYLGTLPPDRFVPQIESAGFAWKLAEVVAKRAFAEWSGDSLARLGLRLAVNLPLDVLMRPGMAERLEQWRTDATIDAGRIVVELTETHPVDDPDALGAVLGRLQAAGYGLAMDDVGPDLRDHEELIGLPFTAMKLDKDLVKEPEDGPAQDFLDRAIAAAQAAGLTVIAEGVEDAHIWARMAARGVDAAQGFMIARPLPAAAVPIWHAAWQAKDA